MARAPQPIPPAPRVVKTVDIYESGLVTIQGAADIFGLAYQSVRAWIRDGAPIAREPVSAGRGNPALVSVAALSDWRRDRAVAAVQRDQPGDYDIDEEKARKTAYEADLAMMKARRAAGELVPIDAAASALDDELAEVRAALVNLPSRVSADLAMITDQSQIRERIRAEVTAILSELSDGASIAARARDDHEPADDEGADDDAG